MEELYNATIRKQFLSPSLKKTVARIQFTMGSFRFMGTQCPGSSISSLPGPVTNQEMLLTGHVILCCSWQWPYSRIPGNYIMLIPLELDIDSTECTFAWLWHLQHHKAWQILSLKQQVSLCFTWYLEQSTMPWYKIWYLQNPRRPNFLLFDRNFNFHKFVFYF